MEKQRVNILSRHETYLVCLSDNICVNNFKEVYIDIYYFVFNKEIEEGDLIVVIDYPKNNLLNFKNSPCILWQSEPKNIYDFPLSYLNKFDYVISALPSKKSFKNTWIKGLTYCAFQSFLSKEKYINLTYDNLKTKNISLVTSNLTVIPEHIKRVKFVKFLKKQQNFIDILGFDKKIYLYDGFRDYKYTIVLENTIQENHFTEKIVDALRCGCFIFYYGCSNIHNYFDKNSVIKIDINNMQGALNIIKFHIDNNSYEKNITSIKKNKEIALNMNPYGYLVKIIKSNNITPGKNFGERSVILNKKDKPIYALGIFRYFYMLRYLIYKNISKFVNYFK